MAKTDYPVRSSAIVALSYDDEDGVMFITFKDGRGYSVEGVSEIEVERLANADSPGNYWNTVMRGKY